MALGGDPKGSHRLQRVSQSSYAMDEFFAMLQLLNQRDMLPLLVFNLDRGGCESLAGAPLTPWPSTLRVSTWCKNCSVPVFLNACQTNRYGVHGTLKDLRFWRKRIVRG